MSVLDGLKRTFAKLDDAALRRQIEKVEAELAAVPDGVHRDRSHAVVDGMAAGAKERFFALIPKNHPDGPIQGELDVSWFQGPNAAQLASLASLAGSTVQELMREYIDAYDGHEAMSHADAEALRHEKRGELAKLELEADRRDAEGHAAIARHEAEARIAERAAELERAAESRVA